LPVLAIKASVAHAHLCTHVIVERDALNVGPIKCSSTAVGPHALLTASHCELPVDELFVDGKQSDILGRTRDGGDHTILFLSATFKDWATFADALPDVSDHVFIFGNPGRDNDMYREGYVSNIDGAMLYLDMNGFPGDSGSALFNEEGKVCGIVSLVTLQATGYDEEGKSQVQFKLMGARQLNFTKEQKAAAASWKAGDAIPSSVKPTSSLIRSLFGNN